MNAPPTEPKLRVLLADDYDSMLVAWRRLLHPTRCIGTESMAIKTEENHSQEMWTTLNPNQRTVGEQLELLFSYATRARRRGLRLDAVRPQDDSR